MATPAIEVVVSEDGLEAVVAELTPEVTPEGVLAAIKSAGVTHGVLGEAISNAIRNAQQNNRPVTNLVVAKGTPPISPVPPRIDPPEGEDPLVSLGPVRRIFAQEDPKEIPPLMEGLSARTVRSGDLLGTLVLDEGTLGKSVTGESSTPQEGSSTDISPEDPGPGVVTSGVEFRASIYGYAGILDGQVAVIPPFWVTADLMTAAYIHLKFEAGSKTPADEDLKSSLHAADVTWGIEEAALKALSVAIAKGKDLKPLIPVASGEIPVEPEDAVPEFSFPFQTQAGVVNADGSINLRERDTFPGVEKGQTLAQGKAAIPGTAGHTVNGDEIQVRSSVEAELIAGENVQLEGDEPTQKLTAEIDGGVSCQVIKVSSDGDPKRQYTVAVRPVAQISGDVDYEVGNLDFKGNVDIKGTIVGGFTVKATGDITVGETVEAGARVSGGSSLTVKQGIVGEDTHVEVEGNITAKFIQDATVLAGGDIVVGGYIRSARVSSKGHVHVEGGGGTVGGILGGEVWASQGVVSKNIGSEHTSSTVISVGIDQASVEAYQKAKHLAKKAKDLRESLLHAIGISTLKTEEIRKRILAQPRRKHEILRYVQKANTFAKSEDEYLQQINQIGSEMTSASRSTFLDVKDTAYPKVTVRIGDSEKTLDEALQGVRFQYDADKGIVPIDLSSSDTEG